MNFSKRQKGVAELRDLFAKCATKKKNPFHFVKFES